MPLPFDSAILRAVAATIVPESAALGEDGWRDLEEVIAGLLRGRPASLQKQLGMFLGAIEWLPVFRYGRRFTRLNPDTRTRVLAHLQNDRIPKIRVGFWGLRTLVLAGYYGRPEAARAIGYAASASGWEAPG